MSNNIKVNIFFKISKGPYGGGNQFLKALKAFFIIKGVYEDNAENADIILFNSHHHILDLVNFKRNNADKIIIHRIDGPVTLIREKDLHTDKLIYKINNIVADATIFQSKWSKEKNYELGFSNKYFETIIFNAPDSTIFNHHRKKEFKNIGKYRIIASSWSPNMKKGFETYKWLDKNLDFDKFEMFFIGNSPFEYENIKVLPPVSQQELAEELKKSDIYITASENDPCSNALLEAMHCGLPAVVLNAGGHPEIVKAGGGIFNKKNEILELLNEITKNYKEFTKKISLPDIEDVGMEYLNFFNLITKKIKSPDYKKKRIRIVDVLASNLLILKYKLTKNIKRKRS